MFCAGSWSYLHEPQLNPGRPRINHESVWIFVRVDPLVVTHVCNNTTFLTVYRALGMTYGDQPHLKPQHIQRHVLPLVSLDSNHLYLFVLLVAIRIVIDMRHELKPKAFSLSSWRSRGWVQGTLSSTQHFGGRGRCMILSREFKSSKRSDVFCRCDCLASRL